MKCRSWDGRTINFGGPEGVEIISSFPSGIELSRPPEMDVNRDEAERCLQIGVKAFRAGDHEKALRFFTKSNNMYPTAAAQQWIKQA